MDPVDQPGGISPRKDMIGPWSSINIGSFESLRNILCDEILFNPLDETVTVTKLQLRNGSNNSKVSDTANGKTFSNEILTTSKHREALEDLTLYNDEPIEDMVCLGATFIITIILLSVLAYCYLYKDYE